MLAGDSLVAGKERCMCACMVQVELVLVILVFISVGELRGEIVSDGRCSTVSTSCVLKHLWTIAAAIRKVVGLVSPTNNVQENLAGMSSRMCGSSIRL